MHPNPAFRENDLPQRIAFARERAFGVLAVEAEGAPLISHVPFLLNEVGDLAELHLVRSNPITRALKSPLQAKIAISGPDSYISPDWYEMHDQVPTWNYVAVHLTGVLELRPQEELLDLLDRQSAFFEKRLAPKSPWTTSKMSEEALTKMMRMIVPCRMAVENIEGTWKLGQNKPDNVRKAAAGKVAAYGIGAQVGDVAALMLGAKGQS